MVTDEYLPGILEDKGQVFTSLPDLFFDKCFNDLIYQVSTRPFLSTTSAWPSSSISRTGYGWVSKTLSFTKCLHRPYLSTSIHQTLLKYLQDWLRMSIHKAFLLDKYLQDIIDEHHQGLLFDKYLSRLHLCQTFKTAIFQPVFRVWRFFFVLTSYIKAEGFHFTIKFKLITTGYGWVSTRPFSSTPYIQLKGFTSPQVQVNHIVDDALQL
jgi:hypothetical protein